MLSKWERQIKYFCYVLQKCICAGIVLSILQTMLVLGVQRCTITCLKMDSYEVEKKFSKPNSSKKIDGVFGLEKSTKSQLCANNLYLLKNAGLSTQKKNEDGYCGKQYKQADPQKVGNFTDKVLLGLCLADKEDKGFPLEWLPDGKNLLLRKKETSFRVLIHVSLKKALILRKYLLGYCENQKYLTGLKYTCLGTMQIFIHKSTRLFLRQMVAIGIVFLKLEFVINRDGMYFEN